MAAYPQTYEGCIASWTTFRKAHHDDPSTTKSYVSTLGIVVKDLREGGRTDLPYKWTAADAYYLINKWNERGLAVKTQMGYMAIASIAAKHFDNLAIDRERIRWPHDDRPNVDWLTVEEGQHILSSWMDPRQALCIHLELCLGLRRVEVIRLHLRDVCSTGPIPHIDVEGKFHKRRRLPFHPDTADRLASYAKYRLELVREAQAVSAKTGRKFVDSGHLIVHRQSARILPFSEAGTGFDKAIIYSVCSTSGIYFSNHTLRRTFGRTLYYAAGDEHLVDISNMYGHESVKTTLRYIGASVDQMVTTIGNSPFSTKNGGKNL